MIRFIMLRLLVRPLFTLALVSAMCFAAVSLPAEYASAQNAPESSRKQASSKPAAKTPAKTGAAAAKKPAAKTAVKRDDPTRLKQELDSFAKDCISRMNKQRRPGISHKEVKRQPDGSFLARYMAVDPDSLETSYDPINGNKTVKYIGRMQYHEVEYVCSGKNQKQALAGPFNEANRVPVTELIKYKLGKWCY